MTGPAQLRIGVVGGGQIVEDAHLPVLLSLPDVRVMWLTDSNPTRRALLQRMYGVPTRTPESAEEGIAELDVCLLAIPLGARERYLERCAACGVAVYAEKPFARSVEAHRRLMAASPEHLLALGFQRRAYATVQLLREYVASGLAGSLRAVSITEAAFSLRSGGARSFRTSAAAAGGGTTIESGIHALDQVLFIAAAVEIEALQTQGIVREGIDYQTTCQAAITPREGPRIEVNTLFSCLQSLPYVFRFEFDHATVDLPPKPDGEVRVARRNGTQLSRFSLRSQQPGPTARSISQAFILSWRAFLDGVRDGEPSFLSAASSLLTTQWIEQIYTQLKDQG